MEETKNLSANVILSQHFPLPAPIHDPAVLIESVQYFLSAFNELDKQTGLLPMTESVALVASAECISGIFLTAIKQHAISLPLHLQATIVKTLSRYLEKWVETKVSLKPACLTLFYHTRNAYYHMLPGIEKDQLFLMIQRLTAEFEPLELQEEKIFSIPGKDFSCDLMSLAHGAEHYFSAWQEAKRQQNNDEIKIITTSLLKTEATLFFAVCQKKLIEAIKITQGEEKSLDASVRVLHFILEKISNIKSLVNNELTVVWTWLSYLYCETAGLSNDWSNYALIQLVTLHKRAISQSIAPQPGLLLGQYYQQKLEGYRQILFHALSTDNIQTAIVTFNKSVYALLQEILALLEALLGSAQS